VGNWSVNRPPTAPGPASGAVQRRGGRARCGQRGRFTWGFEPVGSPRWQPHQL